MKKHIPNSITCCNLISGCIAIGFAFAGKIEVALLFIIIGAVFDFFDGMAARLLNVSSPIGKELDSLADVITFGAAPSAIIFSQLYVMSYLFFLSHYATICLIQPLSWQLSRHCVLQSSILMNVRH